jgi:hypothetical protein
VPYIKRYPNDSNPNYEIAPINSYLHLKKGEWILNDKSQKIVLEKLQNIATDYESKQPGKKRFMGFKPAYKMEQKTELKDNTIGQFYTGLYVANIEKVNNDDARFKTVDESSNKPEKPEYVIYLCLHEDRKDVTVDKTGQKNPETMSKFIVLLYNDKYILMTHKFNTYNENANDYIVPTEGSLTVIANGLLNSRFEGSD